MDKYEKLVHLQNELQKMKNAGITKAEIICPDDCECCKEYKNKPLLIDELKTLPMSKCENEFCTGRFGAVVEFQNTNTEQILKEEYTVKKHWFHWVMPSIISILFCWTLIVPVFMLLYTFLRWKLDKIYIKDGCLYSRLGIIIIDKKAIPIKQISFITVKADIVSEWLKMGCIYVQSSAFSNDIRYLYIKDPDKMVSVVNNLKKIL